MINLSILLYIIAAVCFFLAAISGYVGNRLPAVNCLDWGLLCWLIADKFLAGAR